MPTMLLQLIPLTLLLLSTITVASELELKNCFAADGSPALNNYPCDPTANVSSCCGSTWICATNLYCRSRSDSAANFVGTCTDRTWKDPACPFIQTTNRPFAYAHFNYTLNTTLCDDMTTCPSAGNTTCCDAGEGIHEIIFKQQEEIPTNAAALPSHYAAEGYSLLSASTTTSASGTSSNTSASSSNLVPKASSSSLTSSTSPATSSTPTASAKGSDNGGQLSNRSQIVLATVIPALALLVGAGTWWETARRNRARKAVATAAISTRSRPRRRSWPP